MPESLGRFERIPFGKATFLEVNPSRHDSLRSMLCNLRCASASHPPCWCVFLYLFVRCLADPGWDNSQWSVDSDLKYVIVVTGSRGVGTCHFPKVCQAGKVGEKSLEKKLAKWEKWWDASNNGINANWSCENSFAKVLSETNLAKKRITYNL